MKIVIFINGFAGSGKDESVKFINKHLDAEGLPNGAVSSIDPVRNMMRDAGYPVDRKSPDDRAALAEIGNVVEKYYGTKTAYAVGKAHEFFEAHGKGIVFIHVREPEMIKKMTRMLKSEIQVIRLLVTRPGYTGVTSNRADLDVMKLVYDCIVPNDGTLADLDVACRRFVNDYLLVGTVP